MVFCPFSDLLSEHDPVGEASMSSGVIGDSFLARNSFCWVKGCQHVDEGVRRARKGRARDLEDGDALAVADTRDTKFENQGVLRFLAHSIVSTIKCNMN